MNKDSTTAAVADGLFAGAAWFDPIEAGLRGRIRGFIEAMLEEELTAALGGSAATLCAGVEPGGTRLGIPARQQAVSAGLELL